MKYTTMNNLEARKLTLKAFELIQNSETTKDIQNILDILNIPNKNRMDISSYPKINFSITADEIQSLIASNALGENLNITDNFSNRLNTPLEKLMYAVLWKNGDLKKIKHIVKGIKNTTKSEVEEGIVFHQFGRFLTGQTGEPIIDQHVIRAFAVYQHHNDGEITKYRKLELLNKKHLPVIKLYREWLNGTNISAKLKSYSSLYVIKFFS